MLYTGGRSGNVDTELALYDVSSRSLWNLWEEIKHEHFQNSSDDNIFLVTDVYASSTWVQEYRISPVVQDKYVVNVQNVRGQDEIPENFNIRTTSMTIQQSPRQYPPISYTILESHLSAARTELHSKRFYWKSLCQYFPSYAVLAHKVESGSIK